ncbi:MAG: hypothetical protein L0I56_03710 [Lacticaseibacillus paracasei]|uniref:Uncharacterized protein n=1 Tax=Lacticaseibacillus paracasei TaxID=1597 RepID=A0A422M9X4_LACPA|nr:hypothetical protein [Lacticaseibacillus paracasei]AWN84284.1 hypothetical protein LPEG9_09955 [Lacticaseibacillus paracasei]MCL4174743.1 hypothetical protein [Lacticaseibacillus paracasei]MDN5968553.1 hypothetical protein [Lacticaseibacillus paracasei]MDN6090862.1 hypothetical protein [Lacticaseibacillus paracasei]MDN6104819.1 hypothetical protein [Lacticaseibacillus paracasei]
MQKHHWQIVAGAFAGLLLVTTGLALRQNHFLLALLWGLHQTFWLLAGVTVFLLAMRLIWHTERPHGHLTAQFIKHSPTNLEMSVLTAINLFGGIIVDLFLYEK